MSLGYYWELHFKRWSPRQEVGVQRAGFGGLFCDLRITDNGHLAKGQSLLFSPGTGSGATLELITVESVRNHRMACVVCIQTNKNLRRCFVGSEVGVGEQLWRSPRLIQSLHSWVTIPVPVHRTLLAAKYLMASKHNLP